MYHNILMVSCYDAFRDLLSSREIATYVPRCYPLYHTINRLHGRIVIVRGRSNVLNTRGVWWGSRKICIHLLPLRALCPYSHTLDTECEVVSYLHLTINSVSWYGLDLYIDNTQFARDNYVHVVI